MSVTESPVQTLEKSVTPNEWKEIDLTIGDGGIKPINPERMVVLEGHLEPGSKLVMIRNEELWATDPETGEVRDRLHSHAYYRQATSIEQELLEHKLFTEGVIQVALSKYFN